MYLLQEYGIFTADTITIARIIDNKMDKSASSSISDDGIKRAKNRK